MLPHHKYRIEVLETLPFYHNNTHIKKQKKKKKKNQTKPLSGFSGFLQSKYVKTNMIIIS